MIRPAGVLEKGDRVFIEYVVEDGPIVFEAPDGSPSRAAGYFLRRPGEPGESSGLLVPRTEIRTAPGSRPVVDVERRVLPGLLSYPEEQREILREEIEKRVPSLITDPEVGRLATRIGDVLVRSRLPWPKVLHAAWQTAGILSIHYVDHFAPPDREAQLSYADRFADRLRESMDQFSQEIFENEGAHVEATSFLIGSARTNVGMILGARARAAINDSIQQGV